MPRASFTLRVVLLGSLVAWHGLRWLGGWAGLLMTFRGRARRQEWFGACLLALFQDLGATFIKVGQVMSTRPDLLPPHVIAALVKLQDQVRPFDYERVRQTILEELHRPPEEIFEELSKEPIASASVAQVHRGRLPDGRRVAVKVRRPGLEKIVELDLAAMRLGARLLALVPSFALLEPVGAVEEFGRAVRLQLDFRLEARNGRRFRKLFAASPDVCFPAVVEELSSEAVLTMEYLDGVKILRVRETPHDPRRLARVGFQALLKMVFEDGFVHADLHPGNIFVTGDGRFALLDLGLVAELEDGHRALFGRYFAAWAQGDGRTMAKLMLELSPPGGRGRARTRDDEAFVAEVEGFVRRYLGKRIGQVQVAEIVFDLLQILRRHRVRLPATFTMVNVAIAMAEGLAKQLDPELDLMQEGLPFFARWAFFRQGDATA